MHLPFVPHAALPLSVHWPDGSARPRPTLVQIPSVDGSAHDWQAPPQPALQQYPWAQMLLRHSLLPPQAEPFGLSPQELFTQLFGDLH